MNLDKNQTMLEIALEHAARGWYVFPVARDKGTLTTHGFLDASVDPEQIRTWWTKWPNANVGFASGTSGKAVLDVDIGLTDYESFTAWRKRNNLPATYTVRSGSRPEFKVHMYFHGAMKDVGIWSLDGCSGQVKSLGGYVLAAGSEALHGPKHDKPGLPYEVLEGEPDNLAPLPDIIRALKKPAATQTNNAKVLKSAWKLPVGPGDNRTSFLMEQTGAIQRLGCGIDAIRARMVELNEDPEIISEPISDERLERTAENCAAFPRPEPVGEVILSSEVPPQLPTEPIDWRTHYHTFEEMDQAPPTEFLIDGFLSLDEITAIAAPVAQRKSLIALNVAHALCTGEALFDYFSVTRKPTRVLYLCPEMGLRSFTDRVKKVGLMSYIGDVLFCRTMSAAEMLELGELTLEELAGAVVIVDTAVRYLKGDENSSEHMRAFAENIFRLMRDGAASVLLLHHSAKGTKESGELSLENSMRGSGELGAFLSSCWATRLQDPEHPYESASYVTNVKQRSFESKPFEVTCGKDCRLHIVGDPALMIPTLAARHRGNKANKDGKDEAAVVLIKAHPKLSVRKTVDMLRENGVKRGKDWVQTKRYDLVQKNGGQMA